MMSSPIARFVLSLTLLAFASTSDAQWQKIAPPLERITVGSEGLVVPSTFTLPSGMQYWVHSQGFVTASTGGDQVDAHYYLFLPTVSLTGFKVRTSPTNEQFLQVLSPQPRSNTNEYFDAVSSSGVPLSFRFFDRNDRSVDQTYYLDNSGSISIELAQWTPELILKDDTLDFGDLNVGEARSLLDSFQAYGKSSLRVTNMWIQPLQGTNIFSFTSERGTQFDLRETTNEISVTATGTARGTALAALHITTSNAYPEPDRIVILRARVQGADVTMLGSDTLDFGVVAAGGTVNRAKAFLNRGDATTSIISVTIAGANVFSATTPVALPPLVQTNLQFAFNPQVVGDYFAAADVFYEHGGSRRIYLKGRAGEGIPSLSTKLIDFGRVLIGMDSTIQGLQLSNIGDVEYYLDSVTIDNDQFSFRGIPGNVKIGPKAGVNYEVTFTPIFHLDPYHEGRMIFHLNTGAREVVILRGRDDSPLSALLKIDTNYYYRPGDEVRVTQKLIGELALTAVPIRKFTEFIQFDKEVLELLRVEKGELISSDRWTLQTSQVGGAIDIAIQTGTERLTGPGRLLHFVFKIRATAKPGTVTRIGQVTPDFYNEIEPLATVEDGVIHILEPCTPIIRAGIEPDSISFIEPSVPNPFSSATELTYHLGREGKIRIDLLNSMGELVKTLLDRHQTTGYHKLRLDASDLPNGNYFCLFTANGIRQSRKLTVLK